MDDDDEEEERVEVSSVEGDESSESDGGDEGEVEGRGRVRDVLGDSIEVVSDESPQRGSTSPDRWERGESPGDDPGDDLGDASFPSPQDSPRPREAKRRKLSISPLPAFSSPNNAEPDDGMEEDGDEGQSSEDGAHSPGSSEMGAHGDYPSDVEGRPKAQQQQQQQQQPTFQPPPRFKQLDGESLGEGLPAVFSPQRRGAKYLTGGLAAELQGWLSEVKGGDELAGSTFRVTVGDVRAGRRMYLVRGKVDSTDELRRVILAGEGRLTGLERRATVVVGSVVEVGQPVWDVEVDGETWLVACDWTIP